MSAILWFLGIVALLVLTFFVWFCLGALVKIVLIWAPSLVVIATGAIFAYWIGGFGGAIALLVTLGVSYKVLRLGPSPTRLIVSQDAWTQSSAWSSGGWEGRGLLHPPRRAYMQQPNSDEAHNYMQKAGHTGGSSVALTFLRTASRARTPSPRCNKLFKVNLWRFLSFGDCRFPVCGSTGL